MSSQKKVFALKKVSRSNILSSHKTNTKRRPLNRFEAEADIEGVSASAKKRRMSSSSCDVDINAEFGYRFINFVSVMNAIAQVLVCKKCGGDVNITESALRGLGFKIVISCKNCEKTEIPNCPYVKNGYEINRRITLAMRLLGVGLHGMKKFCAFMELPRPIYHSFYDKLVRAVAIATKAVRTTSMQRAAAEEKALSLEKGQTEGITVSGDGSWRKRGFSSLYGITSLIGWFTGKVIDIEVKSKYCKSCEFWKNKEGTAKYEEWYEEHKEACQSNHEGSSGKMEVDSVVEMFKRSEELHGTKYAYYIGDGDSKTFNGIIDSAPYENLTVRKKECIDHVQKRMGTRLRNLKQKTKGLGGKGKLTGKLIDELSIYYGLAIRRNTDCIDDMKKEIWAILYHKLSTDEKPQHDKCPPGADSWCTWQKAKAMDALSSYRHNKPLNIEVFEAIKPIYEELSTDDLLTRCLGGFTQNNNKTFNSTVWNLAPKTTSSGKFVLDIASDIAACTFNDGLSSIMNVMKVLGMTIGPNCSNFCLEADALRNDYPERSLSDAMRDARSSAKSSIKTEEEENLTLEKQLYGAVVAE